MPWKELCLMSVREEFVLSVQRSQDSFAELCREYGISRKTGYKWVKRYEANGFEGLEDLDRRPHHTKLKLSGDVVAEIVRLRQAHPTWGARKLAHIIKRDRPTFPPPSERAAHRVLVRSGFLQPGRRHKRRRRKLPVSGPPRVEAKKPNDLWTVDFKGWWLALDKSRCEPLTIRDACSRYILRIEVLPTPRMDRVRAVFEKVFAKYGLPKTILTDNGPPFVSTTGDLGLTQLSRWWLSLGIEHVKSRVATPSDNGGHERMHKDIAAELEPFAEQNRTEQQDSCERWRHDFNHHRPHAALGMKTPSEVYRRSEVEYEQKPVEFTYPASYLLRKVSKRGIVTFRKKPAFLSYALQREVVALEKKARNLFDVWYGTIRLGEVDFTGNLGRLHAVKWKDESHVLPMTVQ